MKEYEIENYDTLGFEQQPLVSVIVATYRRKKELLLALESLANQTYKNIEIIVIDDNDNIGWNECVKKLINDFKRKYSFIDIVYIVNHPNLGSAKSRNIGLETCKGDYVTFLDDDDLYLDKKIEKQLKDMIDSNADYGITDLNLYNEKNKLIDQRIRSYIKSTSVNELMRYHLLYHMTGTDTLMFKSKYLRSIGGFPEIDIGDEFYLMEKAILGEGKFVYSPHCYVKAYIHSGDSSGLSSGKRKIDGENALFENKKNHFNYLQKKEVRYIKTRHYAVIAFAEMRMRKYGSFIKTILKAFCISPIDCIHIFINR